MNDRDSAIPSSTNSVNHVSVGGRLLTHDEFDRALKAAARTYPVDKNTLVKKARMELARQPWWWWQRFARLWRKLRLPLLRPRP